MCFGTPDTGADEVREREEKRQENIKKGQTSIDTEFNKFDDPFCLAQKLLRVNLSDIAAMGAKPYGYTLNLSIPKLNHKLWLKKFCSGLAKDTKIPIYITNIFSKNSLINVLNNKGSYSKIS